MLDHAYFFLALQCFRRRPTPETHRYPRRNSCRRHCCTAAESTLPAGHRAAAVRGAGESPRLVELQAPCSWRVKG